jgi:hypothetical protein
MIHMQVMCVWMPAHIYSYIYTYTLHVYALIGNRKHIVFDLTKHTQTGKFKTI